MTASRDLTLGDVALVYVRARKARRDPVEELMRLGFGEGQAKSLIKKTQAQGLITDLLKKDAK